MGPYWQEKSRDVIFLEDQTIEDFDKSKKFKVSNEVFVDPISPPAVYGDGGGDEYDIPTDTADNQVLTSDEEQEDHVEQAPHVKPQLRRSTREHQPSRRYSPSKYVLLVTGENQRAIRRLWSMNTKQSS